MTYSREEILSKVDEITNRLDELEEVERFKALEARLNDNQKVKDLIDQMKGLQKQAVNLQAYGKVEAVKHVDAQIDAIQAEIDAIPIVEEFKSSQVVVNDMLQLLIDNIDKKVDTKFKSIE
ncbi:YlbF family regulator [Amphibacillus sp. MSJ-3]|uniref:RicAFT regulatory complex protein RicA family protein n=1 Tax=Amphibacillus sp. MSJ-3 TaxID=2841505 RepID=UPI001C0F0FB4|nr:YlbF family regulator [Amphibacillus sp. MSJ-3]